MANSNYSRSFGSCFGLVLLSIIFLECASATSIYTVKAKVQEGVSLSSPHRTAIGIACSEETLHAGMSLSELELLWPSEYSGTYVQAVDVRVESKTRALVVITYKAIETAVKAGDMIVYFATCGPGGTAWNVSGTLQKKYWPKH